MRSSTPPATARLATALLGAALLASGLLVAASAPAAAQPSAPAFTPAGRYALVLSGGSGADAFAVPFSVVVRDSAGGWVGQFVGSSGRARPLVAVVPRPAERAVIVQYQDNSGFATMLLRVQGDSVRGATEYADGTFQIRGTRGPATAALPTPR